MDIEKINNISEYLPQVARQFPNRRAVIFPDSRDRRGRVAYTHLTFAQLNNLSDSYAREFRNSGIVKGTKTLMLLKPSLEFIAAVFAVFKTGAVPVLIDPGMGKDNLLNCIKSTAPEALIAISKAHWIRLLFSSAFKSVKILFSSGFLPPPGVKRLENIQVEENEFPIEKTSRSDTAAILFTTGSTGPPKGVVYTHGIFIAQTEIIRSEYQAGPEHMDMPAFPLFALFSTALGMSCVIPDMDPTRPAKVNPERIIEAVNNQGVSFSFASPALWRVVADYCIEKNIKLKSLKKALMAGAPVSSEVHSKMKQIIAEDGETIIPYGATESLPIANFTGSEMLAETAEKTEEGKGYCVGYPIKGLTIKVIETIEKPIEKWDEKLVLPQEKVGEIVVKGPVVTPEYYQLPEQTENAKIKNSDGQLWHRMGDIGYFDEKGRLWFCGRKSHRVITEKRTYYPVCCESIFNRHQDVFRTALVGVKENEKVKPALVVEPLPGKMPRDSREKEKFISELKEIGKKKDFTSEIDEFHFHPDFPVDIRHNAKIFREKLALWAQNEKYVNGF